jgi:hypothetical protein
MLYDLEMDICLTPRGVVLFKNDNNFKNKDIFVRLQLAQSSLNM